MIDLQLTNTEAIQLDSELDLLRMLLNPSTPSNIRAKLMERKLSPEIERVIEKLRAELDNLLQAQQKLKKD